MATFCPWGLHGATAKMMRQGHRYEACNGWDAPECAISAGLYVGGSVLAAILPAVVGASYFSGIGGLCMIAYTQSLRKNIRDRRGIQDCPLSDFCCHCWCHPCAVAQEHYEVKCCLPPTVAHGVVPTTVIVQPVAQSMHAPQAYPGQQPHAPQHQPHAPQRSYSAQPSRYPTA